MFSPNLNHLYLICLVPASSYRVKQTLLSRVPIGTSPTAATSADQDSKVMDTQNFLISRL